ncbi:NADH dehydrogenase [ubiquinone] iron-sulfur protein 5-like [Spodoptera litura]|uniref:NADH dehydrogenase [ubiquinone] iron-sulfur protein 5-like n=1 Tax=Spodoptera litura TaxID=69820 RepID=A0A9J7DLF3_SPOLT|nr:NADH dehydrogenase [ubiquinone] iron-sulfur protein 5-like [Spodoptera litura]
MSLSPFLRSPFTDLTGGIHSHQMLGRCQKEEGRYMECLEAYGLERGKVKCAHLFDDFHECQTSMKQYKRFVAMRRERDRQIAAGKLTGDEKFVSPKIDSY